MSDHDTSSLERHLALLKPWGQFLVIYTLHGGPVAILVLIVLLGMAKDIGMVEDRAALDRREMKASMQDIAGAVKAQSKSFKTLEDALTAQKEVAEKDAENTRIIAQSLCFSNRDLTEKERHACVGSVR